MGEDPPSDKKDFVTDKIKNQGIYIRKDLKAVIH
jgi:hypothetical protein